MKYAAYIFVEPGMDRPCFSHHPPSEEQKKRFAEKGTKVFAFELEVPGFRWSSAPADGKLQDPLLVPVPLT